MRLFRSQQFAIVLISWLLSSTVLVAGQAVNSTFGSLPHEYFVRGTVVAVNAKQQAIIIRGDRRMIGRLHHKSYRVRHPDALLDFRPGDHIKAVFSTRDRKLYHLLHVTASEGV